MESGLMSASAKIMLNYEAVLNRLESLKSILPAELHQHVITVRDYIRYFGEKPKEIYVLNFTKTTEYSLVNPTFLCNLGSAVRIGLEVVPTNECFCLKRLIITEYKEESDSEDDYDYDC